MASKLLQVWVCRACSLTFFIEEKMERASCPKCGLSAELERDAVFIERTGKIDEVFKEIMEQECADGCWVYEEGVDEGNYEEAVEVVRECPIAELKRIICGVDCLREVCRNPAVALLI